MGKFSRHQNNTAEVIETNEPVEETAVAVENTAEIISEQLVEVVEPVIETPPVTETKKSYDVAALFTEHKTKSGVIRFLSSENLKTGEITKILQDGGVKSSNGTPIRYQHVRNVLTQPLKKVEAA